MDCTSKNVIFSFCNSFICKFFSGHFFFLLLFPIHKNMEDVELRFSNNIPLGFLGLLLHLR